MKALYFEEHGELDVIEYGDMPEPETGARADQAAGAGDRPQLPGHLGAARLARA